MIKQVITRELVIKGHTKCQRPKGGTIKSVGGGWEEFIKEMTFEPSCERREGVCHFIKRDHCVTGRRGLGLVQFWDQGGVKSGPGRGDMGKSDRKRRLERQAGRRLALLGVCPLFTGQQRALSLFKQASDMIITIVFLKKVGSRMKEKKDTILNGSGTRQIKKSKNKIEFHP